MTVLRPVVVVPLEQVFEVRQRMGGSQRAHLRVASEGGATWISTHSRLRRRHRDVLCWSRRLRCFAPPPSLVRLPELCDRCLERAFQLRLLVPARVTVHITPDRLPQVRVLGASGPYPYEYRLLATGSYAGPLGLTNAPSLVYLPGTGQQEALAAVRAWYLRSADRILALR